MLVASLALQIVGAGPGKHFDTVVSRCSIVCEIRVHPTGKILARMVCKRGQFLGHETTFADHSGTWHVPDDVDVEHGDTDTAPYGLHVCQPRSTPVVGAATALAARKVRDKAKKSPPTSWKSVKMISNGN